MGRLRKSTDRLSRVRDNRGYEPSLISLEIQKEILKQYERIQESLSSLDLIEDLEEYKTLITLLLKIESQVKGFTFNADKLEFNNLEKLLEKKMIDDDVFSEKMNEKWEYLNDFGSGKKEYDMFISGILCLVQQTQKLQYNILMINAHNEIAKIRKLYLTQISSREKNEK
jgi:hypothetical protein